MEVTRTGGPPPEMYNTTNQTYGHAWQTGAAFTPSFTRSEAYQTLTNRRQVTDGQLPKVIMHGGIMCLYLLVDRMPFHAYGEKHF